MLKVGHKLELRIRTLKKEWAVVYDMLRRKDNSDSSWDKHMQRMLLKMLCHKEASQFRHCSFPYYDQLTSIYAKGRATRKDAQTTVDIVKEIDVEDEADVSLDEMDILATQLHPSKPN
ncbi:hypothetical protein PVK06_027615 [Gossypium arboreum]|uniref:Uncharacterized protein n=1 Tax=Gossypium arboreum TaxID=29729 RepID=A0ABR0P0U5_GOSAR|nr:hypothetical protein PVK06_027615 [Gossypium arboreum]